MFTQSQMEQYYVGVDEFSDMELVPPRTFNVNDYPDFPGSGPEFGDGNLLVLGFVNSDLADCDCGESHITYGAIRADGMIAGPVTSNTFGEVMAIHPDLDPLAMMFGQVPESEGIAPTWDEMREVRPDEWPAESVDVPTTDMPDYEF